MNGVTIGTRASVVDENGNVWFSHFYFNGLFFLNTTTMELKCVDRFPDCTLLKQGLHKKALCVGDYIVFIPLYDDAIRLYNKRYSKFNSITLEKLEIAEISEALVLNDKILLFSKVSRRIYELDINSYQIIHEITIENKEDESITDTLSYCYGKGFILYSADRQTLYKINFSGQIESKIQLENNYKVSAVTYINDEYILFLRDSSNVLCVSNDGMVTEITDEEEKQNIVIPYSSVIDFQDELYIANYYGDTIKKIEQRKLISIYRPHGEIPAEREYGAQFSDIHSWNGDLYFIPQRNARLIKYDGKTKKFEEYEPNVTSIPYEDAIIKDLCIVRAGVLREGEYGISLYGFLKRLEWR